MKVYIVMEHPEGFGSEPDNMGDMLHGIFFEQERAFDFMRGMLSYMNSYEGRKFILEDAAIRDENHTPHFFLVEKGII